MQDEGRERTLTQAFVGLADTLVSDFDVADMLHSLVRHSVELLDADAAGLLLSDQRGGMQVLASSSERTRMLELLQIQANEGPCLECGQSGEPVAVPDLRGAFERWPQFAPAAVAEGYAAVFAVPLRLRDEVIGAMNLFRTTIGDLPEDDQLVARGLADVATIGILQERALHDRGVLVEQLQGALNSRVVIEQAKGVIAERAGIEMDDAFTRIRNHARRTSTRLAEVAAQVVEGTIDVTALVPQQSSS
jgi:transcriptional regulator with GAF, ATPase, and Fis domain